MWHSMRKETDALLWWKYVCEFLPHYDEIRRMALAADRALANELREYSLKLAKDIEDSILLRQAEKEREDISLVDK